MGDIEKELQEKCEDMLQLILNWLIPQITEGGVEAQVFYMKMKGDYYRYLAEFSQGSQTYREEARIAYDEATNMAVSLPVALVTRLGLALNYSVFYYEVLQHA